MGPARDFRRVPAEKACCLLENRLLLRKVEDLHRRRPDFLAHVDLQRGEGHRRQSLGCLDRLSTVDPQNEEAHHQSLDRQSLDRLAPVGLQREEDHLDRPGLPDDRCRRGHLARLDRLANLVVESCPTAEQLLARRDLAEAEGIAKSRRGACCSCLLSCSCY